MTKNKKIKDFKPTVQLKTMTCVSPDSDSLKYSLTDPSIDLFMNFNFEHLGSGTNRRAHRCFCEMDIQSLKKLSQFLHRAHHCRRDEFLTRFENQNSNLKFRKDLSVQVKHIYVDKKFRLHGFKENNIFNIIAIDPTHEDGKN
ncbi:hypothetical protein MsAg5_14050 [Methanosarcinaceae archaeon Ag5]|uniref:Uncharacterized protein n=1 Tax=Methanolapillus africanus TaxID=3028297 RepID=A0AAE4SFN5_9EURY|nr:hypothetical protein [Methanosarcinaceae archaeon Ag5]